MISVALIEDNRLVREGMTALLTQTADFTMVAAESSAGFASLKDVRPDVILLDVGLGGDDGLLVAETVMKEHPDAKVIIMDLRPGHEHIVDFVNAGVSGFILKDATAEDLVCTIRSVAEGAHVLPPEMTSTLFSQISKEALVRGRAVTVDAVHMTAREREVIALIGEGLSNKEIAVRLNIATHTAKSHVRNVMEKLALHTRLQIAAFSHRTAAN
ncbi:MAG: response regulator transcription factor [Gemmatimonadota bacterium]